MSGSDYIEPTIIKLRNMWLNRAFANPAEQAAAAENFDLLIQSLIDYNESEDHALDGPTKPMSQMFLELMIELDSAVKMIPPKVAAYRDLLALHGLDASARKGDEDGQDTGGRQGMAGINVADQGALEYHGALMRLASMFANAVLEEANSSSPDA